MSSEKECKVFLTCSLKEKLCLSDDIPSGKLFTEGGGQKLDRPSPADWIDRHGTYYEENRKKGLTMITLQNSMLGPAFHLSNVFRTNLDRFYELKEQSITSQKSGKQVNINLEILFFNLGFNLHLTFRKFPLFETIGQAAILAVSIKYSMKH